MNTDVPNWAGALIIAFAGVATLAVLVLLTYTPWALRKLKALLTRRRGEK